MVGISRTAGLVAVVCQAIGRRCGRIARLARLAFARPAAATAAASATTAARLPLFVALSRWFAVRRFSGADGLVDQVVAGTVERVFAVVKLIALAAGATIDWLAPFGCGQALTPLLAPRFATLSAAIPAATAAATAATPTTTATRTVFTLALAFAPAIARLAARHGTECRCFVIVVAAGLGAPRFLVASALDRATFARCHGPILE
jgi:hypothetical protein